MLVSVITFLIVLSVLVLAHELGHFIMAKRAHVLVEEFGLGLPPRAWGKKIGETIYSLNWLPFGGFVKLHGESGEETVTDPSRAFLYKSKKARSVILVAGVFMNFILAIVLFAIGYSFSGIPKETKNVRVVEITETSPAKTAGLVIGDIVRKVDKDEVVGVSEFVELVDKRKGKTVNLEIERLTGGQKETLNLPVKPRENPPTGEGPLGVTITTTEIYFPPIWQRPFIGIYYGFKDALFWGKNVVLGFVKIFTDLARGQAPKDIAGPVGIFAVTSQAAKYGILSLINFMGILSVNLAILNVLPFPALDGGRLLFVIVESVIGKKVVPKVEATVHTIGMIILLLLILAITVSDVQRLISAGSISKFLDGIR